MGFPMVFPWFPMVFPDGIDIASFTKELKPRGPKWHSHRGPTFGGSFWEGETKHRRWEAEMVPVRHTVRHFSFSYESTQKLILENFAKFPENADFTPKSWWFKQERWLTHPQIMVTIPGIQQLMGDISGASIHMVSLRIYIYIYICVYIYIL